MDETSCVFCNNPLDNGDETVVLGERGCEGIRKANEILNKNIHTRPGQSVHKSCRRDFCRHREIRRVEQNSALQDVTRHLRSLSNAFSFKDHCLFCTMPVNTYGKKKGLDVFQVRTFDFQTAIVAACTDRKDKWGQEVLERIEFGRDLPAADAVYHQKCSINFRTGRQVPKLLQDSDVKSQKSKGRPQNLSKTEAFLRTVQYLEENDDEQITVTDLVCKMKEFCMEEPYTPKYMKKKLIDHFGCAIVIAEINGKANVVTFKTTASEILHDFYCQPKEDNLSEKKKRIVETAARLILNDIRSVPTNKQMYPDPNTLSSLSFNQDFLPDSLSTFLTTLCKGKKSDIKVPSIGQAIMQAVRPKVLISPLQIGLGVQLHHHFASRYLIDVLYNLGFCSSYNEILNFESSAAVSMKSFLPTDVNDSTIQFSADNVDHNLHTLDGHDTFHGMGMIASVTPGIEFSDPIPRVNATADEIVKSGSIEIKYYKPLNELPPFMLKKLRSFKCEDRTDQVETLLKISWPLKSQRHTWSGFMQTVQDGSYPGQSSICFLPMIDMNPSDLSCIYSTLHFICKEAKRFGITPVVTFDQPLYWKAMTIIQREPGDSPITDTVLRLGGFHTQMSFLGCIGHVMHSSGLFEVLENIYASNTIEHMMTGKAVSRAVRGHLLVDCALHIIILSNMIGNSVQEPDENDANTSSVFENDDIVSSVLDNDDSIIQNNTADVKRRFTEALELYNRCLDDTSSVDDVLKSENLTEISRLIRQELNSLSSSPTGKLWVQYIEMIDILKKFIKAERTGDWHLHLHCVQEMLPFFAATGHNLYLKSAYSYLQQMDTLEKDHPDTYLKFCNGYHVIRRSNKYWAGISSDLAIEQTLMRSTKTTGGMTRGKGMGEVQRAQWLLSKPACLSINSAMQTLENLNFATSEQHKECTKSRQERDNKDLSTVLSFLESRSPFFENSLLRNIETGVTATKEVNVHNAKSIGQKIVNSMEGQNAFSLSFKRNLQVKTMNEKAKVKTQGDSLIVSPQLLFQRLITAARNITDDVPKIFEYELSNFPSSMFESSGVMRESQKANLAEALWTLGDCSAEYVTSTTNVQYVLDGGSLLHRIPWPRGNTFGQIIDLYVDHVLKLYKNPVIVFDGYDNGPSTKDHTHQRRTKGIIGTRVYFNEETPFKSKKDIFLRNLENKQNFIKLLSEHLRNKGCRSIHADSDADILIVQTALECAEDTMTVLVGEDTDLLVLLCYHMNTERYNIVFQSEMKAAFKKLRVWDMKKTMTVVGRELCNILPFVHAISGCDTTSRMFGIGKGQALKRASTDFFFQDCAKKLMVTNSVDEVCKVGEEAIVCLYGGIQCEGLNLLRFRKFTTKVMTSSKFVEVHTLPPTSDAAKYHILRTFYQIKQWTGESENMEAENFGWTVEDGIYQPIKSSKPPAPENLLKTIYCKCKSECDTRRCNCRKHGLECSVACTECRGNTCCNMSNIEVNDQDSDSDE